MSLSAPRLHAPVLALEQYDLVAPRLATIATMRLRMGLAAAPAPITTSVSIPLTTVSLQTNFDAMIHITFPWRQGTAVELMVDSGNASLIVPSYADIAHLPNFHSAYRVLGPDTNEPWGCPAKILQGPIQIPMRDGGVYTIKNCVFYACTGSNPNGAKPTANFGTGWVSPWPVSPSGITLQSPLSYDAKFPFAEFRYAPAAQLLSAAATPDVNQSSQLTLTKTMPAGYRIFDVKRDCAWMSLTPKSLKIGDQLTGWPGQRDSIAMIDTGGGPVFLSDPDNLVFSRIWPDHADNPAWAGPPSVSCQSTFDQVTVEVGDDNASYSYTVDTSHLPAPVQGLTLVMCEKCYYMMENDGMNVGGISALFNDIVVDYAAGRIGLRPKGQAVA